MKEVLIDMETLLVSGDGVQVRHVYGTPKDQINPNDLFKGVPFGH